MKKKFEEPEMTIVVFGSDDTMICTSGLASKYGGTDIGNLYESSTSTNLLTVFVEPDDQ